MSTSSCPSREELQAFNLGDVSAEQFEHVAGHVTDCPHCDAQLQRLDEFRDVLTSRLTHIRRAESRRCEMPSELVEIARSAVDRSLGRGWSNISIDPGRRLARQMSEGTCRIGKFELQAELGVGSFGYVFRALDTELDRTVAVKIQRAGHLASDEEVTRFLREARSAAQLQHPGIVSLYETGRTEEGVCYLVTEYVEGETLEQRLAAKRPDVGAAARLVAELADASGYAHQHGVIHRDLKPSNVMIDDQGRTHIMDFGLAKREAADSTMTIDGQVMGTPAYMSPEQARGQSHEVDVRSDVYSLGVILYELLTGDRPFQGNRRILLLQVLEDSPRPPRQLDETIPRDLETICLKAMSKSPGRRYATARELADDLRRFLRGEAILARPTGYGERLWRWCRRYPLAACLLAAVTLGSAAGFWYLTSLSTYFVRATALDSARMEADMLEEVFEFYSDVVNGVDGKKVNVTPDYASHPGSLPLPATFTIDAGQRISAAKTGMQVRVYSGHPFREDGGPRNDFERAALEVLRGQVAEKTGLEGAASGLTDEDVNNDELIYHEFGEAEGRPVVRFAKGQLMKQSCVNCHNGNKKSPKRDWRVGDLVGVLTVTRPLDEDIRRTRDGLRGAFVIMGSIAAVVVGTCLVFFARAKRGSRSA